MGSLNIQTLTPFLPLPPTQKKWNIESTPGNSLYPDSIQFLSSQSRHHSVFYHYQLFWPVAKLHGNGTVQRCAVSCSVYISEIICHPSTAPSFPLLCYFVFYKNATLHLNLQPGCFQINASKKAIINFILVENVYILLGNICVPSGNAITG